MRKGMMLGRGKGYRNVIGKDPHVHSQSAKGIKQPQSNVFSGFFMARPPLKIQPNVDLTSYAGKWYQIAAKPVWFQKGCENVTAEYIPRPDGTIAVVNSCKKDGKTERATGIARKSDRGGVLKVTFDSVPFFAANYNILYTDYEASLVGTDDRKALWILSRRPTIAKTKYALLITRAKAQGFDVSDLKR